MSADDRSGRPILEFRGVTRHYTASGRRLFRSAARVHAVNGVSFAVMPGETVGLVGESGCGKSTLARLALGMEPPTRGEVRFQAYADYDPGIPGRQLNIMETGGRQLRASVYMYDRRLYITETSAVPGDVAAIQFEQSIMLLEEDGSDVDREGVELVLAFIGSLFSRIFE